MISELRIERFKCYRDESFRLARLTVLAGTNGAGKSTVLQALLLARLFCESKTGDVPLNESYGLKLGELLDVLHHGSSPEEGIRLSVREGESQRSITLSGGERSRVLRGSVPQGEAQLPLDMPSQLFTYLSADRLGPQDTYKMQDFGGGGLNVGSRGEGVGQVLVKTERKFVHEALVRVLSPGSPPLKNIPRQSELWLSHIVRPVEMDAKAIPDANVIAVRFKEPGFGNEWTRPANTGFGLTSALPIIVAALSTDDGGVLLVESPEVHLHPAAQSRMGAFLALVAGAGVQVILETHSDHVLNGLRRAAVVDKSVAPHDVVIHFFDDTSEESKGPRISVSELALMNNGEMSDWPERFFDQIETDLSVLAKARKGQC